MKWRNQGTEPRFWFLPMPLTSPHQGSTRHRSNRRGSMGSLSTWLKAAGQAWAATGLVGAAGDGPRFHRTWSTLCTHHPSATWAAHPLAVLACAYAGMSSFFFPPSYFLPPVLLMRGNESTAWWSSASHQQGTPAASHTASFRCPQQRGEL